MWKLFFFSWWHNWNKFSMCFLVFFFYIFLIKTFIRLIEHKVPYCFQHYLYFIVFINRVSTITVFSFGGMLNYFLFTSLLIDWLINWLIDGWIEWLNDWLLLLVLMKEYLILFTLFNSSYFFNEMINALIDYLWFVNMTVPALKNLISRIKYSTPFLSVQTN